MKTHSPEIHILKKIKLLISIHFLLLDSQLRLVCQLLKCSPRVDFNNSPKFLIMFHGFSRNVSMTTSFCRHMTSVVVGIKIFKEKHISFSNIKFKMNHHRVVLFKPSHLNRFITKAFHHQAGAQGSKQLGQVVVRRNLFRPNVTEAN